MTKHLAASERQDCITICRMCLRERVYPPALLCGACERYIRDCEAEAST